MAVDPNPETGAPVPVLVLSAVKSDSTSASIASVSPPYQSGGTSSAIAHSCSGANCSTLVSHGSKSVHPRTWAYTWLRGNTPREGHLRKRPFTSVETETLIDKHRPVLALSSTPFKDRLATITIARPLVDKQHARKFTEVPELRHHGFRQVINHLPWAFTSGELAAKLQAPQRRALARPVRDRSPFPGCDQSATNSLPPDRIGARSVQ